MSYQRKGFDQMTDRGNMGGVPSNSFNDSMVGEPLTGRHSESVSKNKAKYGAFTGHPIGDHYGRSGSPTGKKFTEER